MNGPKKVYQHFCPAARALEVIGEKWSLLVVRDLLAGPRRFSELRRSLAAITPKWLSQRLRELEEAGIVAREAAGAREVWYRLTPKGEALAPVVEELIVWGVDHALRSPSPGEVIHPGRATDAFLTYLNRRGVRLAHPVTWVIRLAGVGTFAIRYDGARWAREHEPGDGPGDSDVVVSSAPDAWVRFLTGTLEERRCWLDEVRVIGAAESVEEFIRTLGRPAAPASPPSPRLVIET
jgi:DNA-binding HxlR family transcriptional regulator